MAREMLDFMRLPCMLLALCALLLLPLASAQGSLASSCSDGGPACQLILQRLSDDLKSASLAISRGSIMYSYEDNNTEKIDTGHSCTVTADVLSKQATARFSTDVDLHLSGNSLTDPFLLKLEVPVAVSARVQMRQRTGVRTHFGSCKNTASDSFTIRGSGTTRARIAIAVDFNPSFSETAGGNYEVSIEPVVAVAADVDDVNLNFSISGVSPLDAVVTFIHGYSSTLSRATTAVFTGDSVAEVFEETLPFDIGVPVAFSSLGGAAEDLLLDFLAKKKEHDAEREAEGFAVDLEASLTSGVRQALGVSGSGKRTFVISQDYTQTLLSVAGGSRREILEAPTGTRLCTWNFITTYSGNGFGGLHGPVALGQRCTADREGDTLTNRRRGRNTIYRCLVEQFTDPSTAPPEFEPC